MRRLFYVILMIVVILGMFVTGAVAKDGYLWGEEALYLGDEFLITLSRAAQYYAADQGDTLITLNPNLSIEAQIRDLRYMVSGLKVDGIMISPLSDVALKDTIE